MRSNSNKLIRNILEKRIAAHKETKDCIIWEVVPQNRKARVRIQGSSKDIWASYPQSWEQTPPWLKAGNIGKLCFTGGVRGRIELIGTGQLRPTPYDGTPAMPDTGNGGDDLLSGGLVYPIPLSPRMAVMVATGGYRINGTAYALGPKIMGVGGTMYMGDGCPMGTTAAIVNIDSVASGYYRYDLICVGVDGVVDYVKGTATASGTEPALPAVPADHVFLGRVFVYPGLTAITANELSAYYTPPVVTNIVMSASPSTFVGGDPILVNLSITATLKDQYGNTITVPGENRWSFLKIYGLGTMYFSGGESTSDNNVKIYSNFTGSTVHCSYMTVKEYAGLDIGFIAELENQATQLMGFVTVPITAI